MLYYDENSENSKLQSLLGAKEQHDTYYEPQPSDDLMGNDFTFEVLLFKIILNSELSENPYELSFLENRFADYLTENPDAGFSIQELFNEKWLINSMDEWHFNCESKTIVNDIAISDSRMNHIICFINALSTVSFKDERKIIIKDFQALVDMHRAYFSNTPNVSWFEENDVIQKDGELWLLNQRNNLIQPFLNYVFTKLWSQTTLKFNSSVQKIKWWMEYYELFNSGNNFGNYIDKKNLNVFMKAGMQWIIEAGYLEGWDDEERIAMTKRLLDNPDYLEKGITYRDFPKDIFDRLPFCEVHYFTYYHYISEPRDRVNHLLHLFIKNYNWVNYEGYEEDLCTILKKPFIMCMLMQRFYRRNGRLIADLLTDKRTVFSGCVCLLKYISQDDLTTQFSDVWNQTLKIVDHTIKKMDGNEKSQLIFDLSLYLIESGKLHLESKYNHFAKCNLVYLEAYRVFVRVIPEYILDEAEVLSVLFDIIGNRIKETDIPIKTKEFFFLIDMMEAVKKRVRTEALTGDLLNKGYSILFDSYTKSIKYKDGEHFILSSFKSNLMENKIWGDVVAEIQRDVKRLLSLIEPINREDYSISGKILYEQAILLKSKAVIHFLFISSLLKNAHPDLSNTTKAALISHYNEYFELFQDNPQLDIFDPNSMELLNSEHSLELALECLSCIDKDSRDSIIAYLKKMNPNKLAYMLKYIKYFEAREEIETIILENIDYINTDDIVHISLVQKFINNIILVQNQRLVPAAVALLDEYTATILKKGELFYKESKNWLDGTRMRIARINKDYDTILSSDLKFYQGIVYLESDEHRDYQKAIHIYSELLKDDPDIHNKENLLCAYILGVTEMKAKGEDYHPMLESTIKLMANIRDIVESVGVDTYSSEIFYSNVLYLYSELEDSGEFWRYYNGMPEELKKSKKCGLCKASMLKKEGKDEQADKVIKSLYIIYGNDQEIIAFQKNAEKMFTPVVSPDNTSLRETQFHYYRLKKLNLPDLSQVILDPPCSKEVLLTKMVIDTLEKVNAYSSNLLYNDKASDEDRYSLLFKEFFNFRYGSNFNFFIGDQSKSGFTGTITQQKRAGLGENDLIIHYENRIASVIEALCLDSVVVKKIFEHVNKLFGYDVSDCGIMFVIIYGTGKRPKSIWDGYCNYLKNGFIDDCGKIKYKVQEQCNAKDFELFKNSHFISDPRFHWMYCTKHKNEENGADILLVHIFIDVLKAQQQETARIARGK